MPLAFAECLLRVYARRIEYVLQPCRSLLLMRCFRYSEIIQAGYRAVLQDIDRRSPSLERGVDSVLTPPATDMPSTPRTFSRNPSYASLGLGGLSDDAPGTGDFSPSTFTTIRPGNMPASPSSKQKKRRSGKQDKEELDEVSPPKKRRQ